MTSRRRELPSPIWTIRPQPQGHSRFSGSITCSMRGRCAGKARAARPARRLDGRRAGAARTIVLALLDFGDGNLDVFENQLHLIGIELLRAFAETCALVLLHEQFEAFDGLFGRTQFALDMKARRAFIVSATTLGFNYRFLRAEERS